nr:MAG TPA: hypothetical protein [Caudoviricetes sp.]
MNKQTVLLIILALLFLLFQLLVSYEDAWLDKVLNFYFAVKE